jgi:hypothetical protein
LRAWANLTQTVINIYSCKLLYVFKSQSYSHIATDIQSVCLGVEPRLGLMTRYSFLIESYSPVHMERPL